MDDEDLKLEKTQFLGIVREITAEEAVKVENGNV